jgi:FtsP/CotA-like multicopper oxidase with cupredoxin domain
VRGDEEPEVDTEAVLVLDDLTLDASGAIAPFGDILEVHGGREGDVSLLNGTIAPSVAVRAGERQRWRIVNAGSARFYRLALAGHRFTLIGGDEGLLSAPREVDELFLMPGDRADVLVDVAAEPGASVALTNEVYARGHGSGVFAAYPVATLEVLSDAALPLRAPHVHARVIEPLDVSGVTPREVRFDETLDSATETVTFSINGESYPDVTPIDAHVGEVAVWDLINESEMDHPFHLHGFFFQVLERDGVAVTPDGWEDTIQLRGEERVRIAFRPDARPGMWMFHCHILEHIDHGMMGMMHVAP